MEAQDGNRILGAVLAGGLSSRFGSDKAQALLDGRRLIDHAIDILQGQCDAVIVIGRDEQDRPSCPDWPRPHMGPLGGIAGALSYAADAGYDAVLTCGVDSPSLPVDLAALLSPAPACLAAQPIIGLWPIASLPVLQTILLESQNHSVRHFAEHIGARSVGLAINPANVNTQADLAQLESGRL